MPSDPSFLVRTQRHGRTLPHHPRAWALRLGSAALAALAALAGASSPASASTEPNGDEPFMRIVENERTQRVELQVAIRAYEPSDRSGPVVYLASAVHLGLPEFYHQLQLFLDAQDVVLYEGVQPPGTPRDSRWTKPIDDAHKAHVAASRARLLASWLDRLDPEPMTLAALHAQTPAELRPFIEPMLLDPFGGDFATASPDVELDGRTTTLPVVVGLGADRRPGGDGSDADVIASPRFLPEPTVDRIEGAGLQQRMADALGLQFQLAVMRHDHPNWRNSDVSLDRLRPGLGAGGPGSPDGSARRSGSDTLGDRQTDAMLQMLSGRGLLGRISSMMTNIMGATDATREVSKLLMIETLARADEIFEAQSHAHALGPLLENILEARNDVVIDDLSLLLDSEPELRTVAIIYGAGHLPGVHDALVSRLGYTPTGTKWVTAIDADLDSLGLSDRETRVIRSGIRAMIEMQTRRR